MGLSNCKKIINKIDGQIWVKSDGQNGTTFLFTLPRVKQETTIDLRSDKRMVIKN